MTFASQLKPLVADSGGPTKAAQLLGVTRQTINLWLRGNTPNLAMQAGALFLLGKASNELPTKSIDVGRFKIKVAHK